MTATVPTETCAERAAYLATLMRLAVQALNDGRGFTRDVVPPEALEALDWLGAELQDATRAARDGGPGAT